MLISTHYLRKIYGVEPRGVLHVGAHLGEEATSYNLAGWSPVVWIEANPQIATEFRLLNLGPEHNLIEAAIWSENDVAKELNISTNSQSSSFLDFGTHSKTYPDIAYTHKVELRTKRLDSLFSNETIPDFINLDIQGVEMQALKGLGELISKVNWIYTEVNREEVYKDCTLVGELDEYLRNKGFKRVATRWVLPAGWGDALYINITKVSELGKSKRLLSLKNGGIFYFKKLPSITKYLIKVHIISRIIR
jgi:FkbM family methyltransferase